MVTRALDHLADATVIDGQIVAVDEYGLMTSGAGFVSVDALISSIICGRVLVADGEDEARSISDAD